MVNTQWIWCYREVILVADSSLVQLIKRIAVEAVNASKPCRIMRGNVKSVKPLEIAVSQKMVLDEDFLIVSDTAKGKIKEDVTVIMIRNSGGQEYVVLDTIAE